MKTRRQDVATVDTGESADDLKDLAYELWLTKCGKRSRHVAQLLDEMGTPVPDRTIRYWVLHDDWENRAYRDIRRMMPLTTLGLLNDIVSGIQESVSMYRSTINDPDQPIDTRHSAARELREVGLPLLERFNLPETNSQQSPTLSASTDSRTAIAQLRNPST